MAHRPNFSRGAHSACLALAVSVPLALSSAQGCPRSPAAPFCSASVVPVAWLSGAALQLRLSARAPFIAALAPRHPLPALSGLRARPARPALPFCPRLVPRLLTLVRLPPSWLVRGVPQAPLRVGSAAATSAVGAHAGTRSGLCGEKFGVKLSSASPCGPAVTTPRPMTTNTTPATFSCSCAPTPSSRLCCWPGSPTWTSSRLPWGFALNVFTVAQQDCPLADHDSLNPDLGHALWR